MDLCDHQMTKKVGKRLILASKSPRRQDLLRQMGLEFESMSRDIDETFPPGLTPTEAVCHIAEKKAREFMDLDSGRDRNRGVAKENEHHDSPIILAADTIVVIDGDVIGKPEDERQALTILTRLSGRTHQVITGCAILHQGRIQSFHETTEVHFSVLEPSEMTHYIQTFRPFDKAGAYGIQEWIGMVGITSITGSYSNVVGLPTARVYAALKSLGFIQF